MTNAILIIALIGWAVCAIGWRFSIRRWRAEREARVTLAELYQRNIGGFTGATGPPRQGGAVGATGPTRRRR